MVNFLAPSSGLAIYNSLHCIPEFHFFQRQTNIFKEVVAYDDAGPGFNLINLQWQKEMALLFEPVPGLRPGENFAMREEVFYLE
jgi:hypothetical protein